MEFAKININVFEDNKSTIKSDIKIISEDNALYYKKRDDEYAKQFNLTPIESGITFQDGQYYYFNHNIIETRKSWGKDNTNFSYDIYFIDEWLKDKIVAGKSTSWEPLFYSYFKYGRKVIATGTIGKYSHFNFQEKVSKLDDNDLYIPYGNIPADLVNNYDKKMKREITISEFIDEHSKQYKNYIRLDVNREVIREIMLSNILK
jgi:hypothetical protein